MSNTLVALTDHHIDVMIQVQKEGRQSGSVLATCGKNADTIMELPIGAGGGREAYPIAARCLFWPTLVTHVVICTEAWGMSCQTREEADALLAQYGTLQGIAAHRPELVFTQLGVVAVNLALGESWRRAVNDLEGGWKEMEDYIGTEDYILNGVLQEYRRLPSGEPGDGWRAYLTAGLLATSIQRDEVWDATVMPPGTVLGSCSQ